MAVPGVSEWLESVLGKLTVPCLGARVTFAASKHGGMADLITCKCEFSCAKLEPRKSFDYGTILLGEAWFTLEEAKAFLASLATGSAVIDGMNLAGKYAFHFHEPERQVAPPDGVTGWSEWAYDLATDGDRPNIPSLYSPLVKVGLRPYTKASDAVATWAWAAGDLWGGGQPPHYGEVRIAIPDARARITSVEWLPARIRVVGEFAVPRDDFEVQAVLQLLGRREHAIAQHPNSEGVVEWAVDPAVVRAEIFVVHSNGDLLWQTDVPNTGSKINTSVQAHSTQELAEREVSAGESDQVEYKPFLIEGDEGTKPAEFIRTIVAFSNSAGGRLYIGVRDDSSLEGRRQFLKAAGTDPDKAESTLKSRLAKMIGDKIKPVPKNYSIEAVEIAGEPVLVVTIPRGEDGPYANHENDIFVRKGGTNRRPDPHSELRGLYPRRDRHGLQRIVDITVDADDEGNL